MNWNKCTQLCYVTKVQPDTNKRDSFEKLCNKRISTAELIPATAQTKSSIILILYDAVRLRLEILANKNELRIQNHVCYTAFLREILNKGMVAEQFDALRRYRNKLCYYAEEENDSIQTNVLKQSLKLLKKLEKL